MKKTNCLIVFCALLAPLWFAGCEISPQGNTHDVDPSSNETVTPAATAATPAPAVPADPSATQSDDLDISSAQTLGQHQESVAQNAAITRALYSANVDGDKVQLSFETLNWPEQRGSKTIDGSVHLFWVDGTQVVGGYFDAHAVGQTVKGLENVYGGYLGGRQPPRGATVYFALVSLDASQRTNVKRSDTPW